MVHHIREAEKAKGELSYELTEKQKKGRVFSRSLYAVKDIKQGDIFTCDNIRSIRPGFGLHPKYFKDIIGKKAKKNFKRGDRLNRSVLEK